MPRDRRRRPVLQSRSHPEGHQDGRRQRFRQGNGRQGRHPVDARSLAYHPQIQGLRRHHPFRQPQSRRPDRRFRHQVQYRQWRPGPRKDHRRHLCPHQDDRRLQDRRFRRHQPRYDRQADGRRHGDLGHRSGRGLCGADGGAVRFRRHPQHDQPWLPHRLRCDERRDRPLCQGDPRKPAWGAQRFGAQFPAAAGFRRPSPGPEPRLLQGTL